MKVPAPKESGSTLLDSLLGLSLVMITVLMLSGATTAVIRANRTAKNVTLATSLAHDKLEELRQLSAGALVDGADTAAAPANAVWSFQRSWTITDNASDSTVPSGTKKIEVALVWTDYAPRQLKLATLAKE